MAYYSLVYFSLGSMILFALGHLDLENWQDLLYLTY